MIIFPAIDIKDNKCVRLMQGKFDKVKIYSDDPVDMAKKWEFLGAEFLHVVDLDGARNNDFTNRKSIDNIVKNIKIPIQIGGGIRSKERVKELLDLGVARVIIGTMAVENQKLLEKIATKYAENLAVSIDAVNGKVATRGWETISDIESIDLCRFLEKINIKTLVYTDILRDGMLKGPNFDIYKMLSEKTTLDIIASGGVSTIEDITRLNSMDLYGAIIGKALYDERISFKEVIKCLQEE